MKERKEDEEGNFTGQETLEMSTVSSGPKLTNAST